MASSDPSQPSDEWPTDASYYTLEAKIGQGAFANVYKASCRRSSSNESDTGNVREVAVKVLNLDKVDANLSEIRLEVQLMRLSSHDNILECFTAFVNDTQLWLVTPYMSKGSAVNALNQVRRLKKGTIKLEPHIHYLLHETLLALKYIHENGQIHRDVKGSNLLLDSQGSVKLADFGVSGWLIPQNEKCQTFVGTPCWMAPEVMEQIEGYDYRADVWSLGITALELAKGYAPYAKYPPMKVLILTIQEDPPNLDSYYDDGDDDDFEVQEQFSKEFQQLLTWCLQKNPTKRPTCQTLLQSKHFRDVDPDKARLALQQEICDALNSPASTSSQNLPGHMPIQVKLEECEEERPAGTTWVFADGSQVLASDAKEADVEDILEELDQFGKQTGGENYDQTEKEKREDGSAPASPLLPLKQPVETEADDLDDFLTEFEQTTAGENFQRSAS